MNQIWKFETFWQLATGPVSLFLSLALTHRVNTLVCTILQWSNKCPSPKCFFYTGSGWPKFAYVSNPVPPETRRVTYKLLSQWRSCFLFFFTSGTPHTRQFMFLSFGVAMKGIQFTQLRCHISFLSFTWLTTCFYPAVDGCWIHVNVGCSACLYSTPFVVSLNDEHRLAHRKQQSVKCVCVCVCKQCLLLFAYDKQFMVKNLKKEETTEP